MSHFLLGRGGGNNVYFLKINFLKKIFSLYEYFLCSLYVGNISYDLRQQNLKALIIQISSRYKTIFEQITLDKCDNVIFIDTYHVNHYVDEKHECIYKNIYNNAFLMLTFFIFIWRLSMPSLSESIKLRG